MNSNTFISREGVLVTSSWIRLASIVCDTEVDWRIPNVKGGHGVSNVAYLPKGRLHILELS